MLSQRERPGEAQAYASAFLCAMCRSITASTGRMERTLIGSDCSCMGSHDGRCSHFALCSQFIACSSVGGFAHKGERRHEVTAHSYC